MIRSLVTILIQINVILHTFCIAQSDLNSTCTVARSNEHGICRFANDCPLAVIEIAERGLYPALCGFHNGKEIICCANGKSATTETTKKSIATKDRISYQSSHYELFYKNLNSFSRNFISFLLL